MRTMAARKAFDEPLDVSLRRKESDRFHPYHVPHVAPKRAPSPPQDQPMDFSTRRQDPVDSDDSENEAEASEDEDEAARSPRMIASSFTSSRELRFAKNLKIIFVEVHFIYIDVVRRCYYSVNFHFTT